ncbi:MAG: FG-GAP-like repeat-containing protein [Verrucomicrobiales bacterium]|nr:FG-GAP-like repeat-containing protein [Verrucomicrobiales bacterium]
MHNKLLSLLVALLSSVSGIAQQTVSIQQSPEGIHLFWINEAPGYLFEQTEVLGEAAAWRPFAIYPVVGDDGQTSISFQPFGQQRFFRLREDRLPTEVRRTPLDAGFERLSWDFTYHAVQLEFSIDDGATWQPTSFLPEIDILSGEFFIEQAVPSENRRYRLRSNQPPDVSPPANASVAIGEQWNLRFPERDAEGDLIRYTFEGLPRGATFDPATYKLDYKPGLNSAGSYLVRIKAADATSANTVEFRLTVPQPAVRATTALTGVVMDANAAASGNQTPIAGVLVTLLNTGARTTTDARGAFGFQDVPAGLQVLNFDPTQAAPGPGGVVYAGFREEYTLLPKIENRISRPIYLPRLAVGSLVEVVTTQTTIVENTSIGVRLTIPPETAMSGGAVAPFTGQLSISEVPRGFEPAAMPRQLQPDLLITIQPVGVTFSQPVAVTFPNLSGYEPGSEAEIWSLDAGTGQFVVVGTGRVSADGQRIETISGGVRATDWHFALPAPPTGAPAADAGGESNPCPAGSEFILNTGALTTFFASPAWISMGEAQELRFIYSSRQAHPQITVPVQMTLPARAATPKAVAISASLPNKGSILPPAWLSGAEFRGGGSRRSGVLVDASDLETGVHTISVETTSHWAPSLGVANNARRGGFFDVEAAVVNRTQSPYGMGWSVAGLQTIHVNTNLPNLALLVEGDKARVFDRRVNLNTVPIFQYGTPMEIPDVYLEDGVIGSPVTSDLDGDGILDIVLFHAGDVSSVLVLKGRGDATFEFLYAQPVSNETITQMVAADFNQDGRLDLAMLSRLTSLVSDSKLHVLLGLGAARFSASTDYVNEDFGLNGLAAGDLDGNGTIDLVAARGGGAVLSYLGRGDGAFADPIRTTLPPDRSPDRISLADLNGDGRADLIGSRFNGLIWALADGKGDFISPGLAGMSSINAVIAGNFVSTDASPEVLICSEESFYLYRWNGAALVRGGAVGVVEENGADQAAGWASDIDGDGRLDALINTRDNQLAVAYGDGQGGFTVRLHIHQPASFNSAGGFRLPDESKGFGAALAADFNKDGVNDLLSTASFQFFNGAAVIRGAAPRKFLAPHYSTGGQVVNGSGDLAGVGDFNNDGRQDILYAGAAEPYWFHASRGDGSFADGIVALPAASGRRNYGTGFAIADFDRDGNLDIVYPAAHSNRRITSVQWGRGDGTFVVNPAAGVENGWVGNETTSGALPARVAAGDINGDGFPDYVVVHASTPPSVWLYDPASPRSFRGPMPVTDAIGFDNAAGVAGGDLNNDGLMDFVCVERDFDANRQSLFFAAFLSRGDGTFRRMLPDFSGFTQGSTTVGIPATYDVIGVAYDLKMADLNRDGRADILFSHANGVWFMSGDGTGSLAAPRLISSYAGTTRQIGLMDLTGDGAPEAVVNFRNGPSGGSTWGTLVLPNVGGRQIFGPAIPLAAGYDHPIQYLGVHANADAKTDLIVLNPNVASIFYQFATLLNVLPATGFEPQPVLNEPVVYASPPGDMSKLSQLPGGTWERRMKDGTLILFDALGRQVSSTDRRGRATRYSYVGNSERVDKIIDPAGREVVFNYAGNQLASVNTPTGQLLLRYDELPPDNPLEVGGPILAAPAPRLTSVTYPGGAVRKFTYATVESNP